MPSAFCSPPLDSPIARATDPTRARLAATWVVRTLAGAGHTAYFAGGCVRDGLLGLHPTDFDVATDATPPRVRALFPRTAEVGAAFGVVLVSVPPEHAGGRRGERGSVSVEVATFRADGPYTDARRPDSVRFSDPVSDAHRRDFTINALFLDPLAPADPTAEPLPGADLQGRVIDHVRGVADLRAKVLRAVGDPDLRLAEDHLRALRAVRFAARLRFALDPATADAIRRHAAELRGVSRERIGEELRRMLAHPSRAAALTLLQDLGLDAPVLGEPTLRASLLLVGALPPATDVPTVLAAWITDRTRASLGIHPTKPAAEIRWLSDPNATATVRRWRSGLCLTNDETEATGGILASLRDLAEWTGLTVARRKRAAAKPWFHNALHILRGDEPAIADHVWTDVDRLTNDGVGIAPAPVLTGDDLVGIGWTPGPRFKAVLDGVYDAQLEGRVGGKADGLELAERLRRELAGGSGV